MMFVMVHLRAVLAGAGLLAMSSALFAQAALGAEDRAAQLAAALQGEERTRLLNVLMAIPGQGGIRRLPEGAIAGAGFAPGIPRLGIPPLRETDASLGVAWIGGARGQGATALPSGTALAAGWDPDMARQAGAMIGEEARREGFNVLLGGGANLVRDPRGGRNFEYLSEDPLLTGVLAGAAVSGTQSRRVVSTIKHVALNDYETGRHDANAVISESAARESDLLAFEIALEQGHPASIMCAYNAIWGAPSCANRHLLTDIVKGDWHFPGWIMSDWGSTGSTDAALAGLDTQSGYQLDAADYFSRALAGRADADPLWAARLLDMNTRVLKGLDQVGALGPTPAPVAVDWAGDRAIAEHAEEQGIVLLENPRGLLPLPQTVARVALIGGDAAGGVLSGGGSSQVAPPGGPAGVRNMGGIGWLSSFRTELFLPPSPLSELQKAFPHAKFSYDDGRYPASAAAAARHADVAVVFATQWSCENEDLPDLTLPDGQGAMIAAVTQANPNTVVVLETSGAIVMPWRSSAGAILAAWYPGSGGAEAIAGVLSGRINPGGRLPVTFPDSILQLPRPDVPGLGLPEGTRFDVPYGEGAEVDYRWFAARHLQPLYPFGFGRSYTTFRLSGFKVSGGASVTAHVTVTNTGSRAGVDVPQLYLTRPHMRLLGWSRIALGPGESRTVSITTDRRLLGDWDEAAHAWRIAPGAVGVSVGESATDLRASGDVLLTGADLPP